MWRYSLSIAFLVLLFAAGCDFFQTRDPASPSQGTSCNLTPDFHDIVLKNLGCAIMESNTDNYIRCFVDPALQTYVFEPSPEEQPKFTQWNLDAERRYYQNSMSNLNGTPSFTDSIYTIDRINGPPATAVYTMRYTLFIPHQDPRAPKFVQGNMELYFREDSLHRWSIYRWVDKKTTADSTWSYLKAWFNR